MSQGVPSTTENIRALETLLGQKRRAGVELLSLDGYERWGAAQDTPENRARMEAEGARAYAERAASVSELTALVERLRREDPSAVARWADAHDEMLAAFIESCRGAEPPADASTGISVATDERAEWAAVKRGEKPFVEENVYYVRIDRERYVLLFDVEP